MLGLPPPPILLSYIREAGFGHAVELKDFLFDRCLIYAIVEQWRPETYTFHLLWGEASITLEDVAYHTGLRTAGEPVGGCTRDFQRWHGHPTWEWAEDLLGARPPPPQQEGRQVFAVRMTWLRNQVAHIPDGASPETLRQYARCYLMMLIGGVFIHGQVGNTCAVEMASTTRGFRSMQPVVMGQSRDHHNGRILSLRRRIDALTFEQFGHPKNGLLRLEYVIDQPRTARHPQPHYFGTLEALVRFGDLVVEHMELWLPPEIMIPDLQRCKIEKNNNKKKK
ncbi:hypothetical protein AHAS_Ahas15G0274300 [Arachis hypogaea]